MAIVINGSGTVTGLAVGGLPDGTVDAGTLATDSVDSAELVDGSIDAAHLASGVGEITEVDTWRLTTSFTGDVTPLALNLERVDNTTSGRIGTGMSVSSGVWTFPSTGIWQVEFWMTSYISGDSAEVIGWLQSTHNDSTWGEDAIMDNFIQQTASTNTFTTGYCSSVLDVTSTSTHKVRFKVAKSNTSVTTYGDTNQNATYMRFTKLGET